jgi:hypothetical protein
MKKKKHVKRWCMNQREQLTGWIRMQIRKEREQREASEQEKVVDKKAS